MLFSHIVENILHVQLYIHVADIPEHGTGHGGIFFTFKKQNTRNAIAHLCANACMPSIKCALSAMHGPELINVRH